MLARVVAPFFCLAALTAQTFVVDANGGAGSHYTSLPTAVAAVPDGAVLIVRPGNYQAFSMSGKGLSILGEPGAVVTGEVQIDTTAVAQAVTIRELTWTAPTGGQRLLQLTDCAGAVLVERITHPGGFYALPFSHAVGISATRCDQLAIRDSRILCTVGLDTTHATIESSTVRGEGYLMANGNGRTAVFCRNGTLVVAGASTVIEGGDGRIGGPAADQPGNGIGLNAASLRVVAGAVRGGIVSAGSGQPVFGGSAIQPVGMSRVSPRATLFSSNMVLPQELADDVMPALVADGAPLGGTLQAAVETEVGDLVVLVVGLPGVKSNVAGFMDPFWLDASVHVFVAIGQQQQGVPVTGAVAVPNNPGLRGFRLHWQAACFGPVTGTQATNPGVSLVR